MRRLALACCLPFLVHSLAAQVAPPLAQGFAERAAVGCRLLPPTETTLGGTTWTGGMVPYLFAANVTPAMQAAMQAAMLELQNAAHVTFVPRTVEADHVVITDAPLNSSAVGRQGGAQRLFVHNWNLRFQMVHELMHVLGFWHEHQRPDRDNYVAVQWNNVDPAAAIDFQLVPTATVLASAYDFDSVLHFAGTEASTNQQPTLLVLPPNQSQQANLGQRTHLSAGDLRGLRLTYGSPVPPSITQVQPPATTAWQPSPIVLTGVLFDEATRVLLDGAPQTFTRPQPDQIRIVLPLALLIGPHQFQVESRTGLSQPAVLQITGNDPPVLEGNSIWVRGTFQNPVRLHTDATRLNVLVGSLDAQPSVLPGVLQLGIGNQFQSLFVLAGPATAAPNGTWTTIFVVPTTVAAGLTVRLQGIAYDPANVQLPFPVSNVFAPRTF